jgi:hypothetical protein
VLVLVLVLTLVFVPPLPHHPTPPSIQQPINTLDWEGVACKEEEFEMKGSGRERGAGRREQDCARCP